MYTALLKHSVQIVVGTKSKHKDLMLARLTGYKSVGDKKKMGL